MNDIRAYYPTDMLPLFDNVVRLYGARGEHALLRAWEVAAEHNCGPRAADVAAHLFPRAASATLDADGMEQVTDGDAPEQWLDDAAGALAGQRDAEALISLLAAADFGEQDYEAATGVPMPEDLADCERRFVGLDGRAYLFRVEEAADGECYAMRAWRSRAPDAPMLLDAAMPGHRRRTTSRFALMRHADVTGISGTGRVAEGEVLDDGRAVVRWAGQWPTITIHERGVDSVRAIHCHGGATEIVPL